MLAWWESFGIYKRVRQAARRPPPLDPSRRTSVCERPHPSRDHAEQGAEGRDRQVALDVRLQRGLRAGLGLPRAADRAPGRQGARARQARHRRAQRDGSSREAQEMPRVRAALHRHPARRVQAPGRVRRLGQPVHDDGPRVPGGHRTRVRALRRPRARLQGAQARPLVHALPDRARAGRGRVRRPADAVGLGQVSADVRPAGAPVESSAAGAPSRWSGPRPRGPFRPTSRSPCIPRRNTSRSRRAARCTWSHAP